MGGVRLSLGLKSSVLLVVFLFAVTGCDFNLNPVNVQPTPRLVPPTATRPPHNGGTLTVRLTADVTSLNPWLAGKDPNAQMVTGLIFSGLTRLDNHLQPQPDLAE